MKENAGKSSSEPQRTADSQGGVRLADGEKVFVDTKPHPAAFLPFYLPGLYLFALSTYLMLCKQGLLAWVSRKLHFEMDQASFYAMLAVAILVPAVLYSFAKLNLRWVINGTVALVVAILVKHQAFHQPWSFAEQSIWVMRNSELLILAVFGLYAVVSNEWYRQSHRYVVTNARLWTAAGVLGRRERTLPISKINDLSVEQDFLGRVFGYATLIPLTASGIGMGSDFAALSGSVSKKWFGMPTLGLTISGGHGIQVPKSRTHEALFGVRHAMAVKEAIMDILARREIQLSGAEQAVPPPGPQPQR